MRHSVFFLVFLWRVFAPNPAQAPILATTPFELRRPTRRQPITAIETGTGPWAVVRDPRFVLGRVRGTVCAKPCLSLAFSRLGGRASPVFWVPYGYHK